MVARGDTVFAIGGPSARGAPGVNLRRWANQRSTTTGIFEHAIRAEADLIRANAAALTAADLKREGFEPDVVIGHPGWGEMTHIKEVFPAAKSIVFGEYFYISSGGDFGFDLEFQIPSLGAHMRINAKNATLALACALADRIVCPTPFQASTFPEVFRPKIRILHEGLNLERAGRRPDAQLSLPNGGTLTSSDAVITYVSRNLERTRGFHIFMRALPEVMAARPDAQVVVLGNYGNSGYGAPLPGGQTWKGKMLAELGERIDPGRIHFLGPVPHARMVDALSISRAHVYYTYPFVLSWSLIEAMACECLIVGSDTAPVRDVVTDGENGLLNDFFDVPALSRTLLHALNDPQCFEPMRARARRSVEGRFDKDQVGVPAWLELVDEVIAQ